MIWTSKQRVLILGGTGEAIALAQALSEIETCEVISSLAGRTQSQRLPLGSVRVGGFGGPQGLTAYLQAEAIDRLVDATHPFAAQISHHAAIAASALGLPHLRLVRPGWEPVVGDRWHWVTSHAAAAALLPNLLSEIMHSTSPEKRVGGALCAPPTLFSGELYSGQRSLERRIFLTIGRQELAAYTGLQDLWFLMRMIDPPTPPYPLGEILLERGPFTLDQERSLLQDYRIAAIVSKNSGGEATYAKLIAARELGLPVVMIARPELPAGDRVATVVEAVSWVLGIPVN